MVLRLGRAVIAIGVVLQWGAFTLWGPVPHMLRRGWLREALIALAISTAMIFLGSVLYGFALAFH